MVEKGTRDRHDYVTSDRRGDVLSSLSFVDNRLRHEGSCKNRWREDKKSIARNGPGWRIG